MPKALDAARLASLESDHPLVPRLATRFVPLLAQVDDTEERADRVGKYDEICVLGVLPFDPRSAQRDQALNLG
jgi:hypothetical protein